MAKNEYGLTEDQALAQLKQVESLSRMNDEYELASTMLTKFSGLTEKQIENLDENKALIKIELMDKSAHMPFHEQEKEYAKEIKDFIKKTATSAFSPKTTSSSRLLPTR